MRHHFYLLSIFQVRDDELDELDDLTHENCTVPVAGGSENIHGKVNILLQTHISRGYVRSFSLISDQNYVVTNASRIARALFEIVLRKNWPLLAGRILQFAKTIGQASHQHYLCKNRPLGGAAN